MNLSKHFKLAVVLIVILSILLAGAFLRLRQQIEAPFSRRNPRASSVLPKNDKEQITFNEKTHILTVQTPNTKVSEYAKNPQVTIKTNGQVSIARHLAGFENEPFIGFGYSDTGRIFLGDNVSHFGRFDLVAAISWTPVNSVVAFKPYAGVGYNFYRNTSINLCINPAVVITRTPDIAGFVSVRF
jgi:hypothetical protein